MKIEMRMRMSWLRVLTDFLQSFPEITNLTDCLVCVDLFELEAVEVSELVW